MKETKEQMAKERKALENDPEKISIGYGGVGKTPEEEKEEEVPPIVNTGVGPGEYKSQNGKDAEAPTG
jgi:hypothetical protein